LIVLDENILEDQRQLLEAWRFPARQIGFDILVKGLKDEQILVELRREACPRARWIAKQRAWLMTQTEAETFIAACHERLNYERYHAEITVDRRRSWRKLHIGVDCGTGQIVAAALTTNDVDDGSQVGPLLDQIDRPIAAFTGDGAYDQEGVYASVADRHPDALVIVPPRSSAVPSETAETAETAPRQRDRHLQLIAERGRMGWQKASGYNWRALVEADIGRWKRVIGDALRSQTDARQATGVAVAVNVLNRMLEMGRPSYVRTA